jgi:hypothetical protein
VLCLEAEYLNSVVFSKHAVSVVDSLDLSDLRAGV